MKAIVIYPKNVTFTVEIPVKCQGSTIEILNYLFQATNPDSGNETLLELQAKSGKGFRSSMLGDLYIILDGNPEQDYYFLDGVGFVKITEAQAIRVQNIPDEDRVMGWDWCRKQYPIIGIEKGRI